MKIPLYLEWLSPETDQDELRPFYASPASAGFDLKAAVDLIIAPGTTVLVPTGLKMAIPEGYELEIRPRSGLSLRSRLRLANMPGTIDSDYRDEVKILAYNSFSQAEIPALIAAHSPLVESFGKIAECLSLDEYLDRRGQSEAVQSLPGNMAQLPVYLDEAGELWGSLRISRGDRIAQALLKPVAQAEFKDCDDVSVFGEDRGGGFGHSGV